MNVRCGNCGTVFDTAEQVCPTCGRGVEDVGIEEPENARCPSYDSAEAR